MDYAFLGKSDLRISRIGFGCMSLHPDNPDAEKILLHALSLGVNYFDTADIYQQGLNEEFLGKTFKGKRDQIILASKVGNQLRPDGNGWDWKPSGKYISLMVEKSLRRLQTDYIDLYQLHGGTLDDPIIEIIETFELLKSQGKIRWYGISSIRPNVIREYIKSSSIAAVMMQYSLLDRRPEEQILDLLAQNQIGMLARGTIAKGLLVSKPASPYLNYTAEEVKSAADLIKRFSDEKRTPAQTAVQFVLQQPAITSAVLGIRTFEQLEEAVGAAEAPLLNARETAFLQQAVHANEYDAHR